MTAALALMRRDYLLTRSYRFAFVSDVAWGVVELAVYFFVSKVVGHFPAASLGAAPSYFAFALAGVFLTTMIGTATGAIAADLREEQLTGTLELLLAQPVRTSALALGVGCFPMAFSILRVAGYLVLSVAVFDFHPGGADWFGVAVILVVSGLAFIGLGVLTAAATIVFKRGVLLADLLIFGMTFVSGSLFPVSVLPGWLQPVGKVMPTKQALDGLRNALFEGRDWGGHALILAGIAVVLLPLSIMCLQVALTITRRRGTLSQY